MFGLRDPTRRVQFSEHSVVSLILGRQVGKGLEVLTHEAWSASRCSSILSRIRVGFIMTHWVSC